MKTLIAVLLVLPALALGRGREYEIEKDIRLSAIYWNILAQTQDYYSSRGTHRKVDTLRKFLDSAYRVARMFEDFPAQLVEDRWTRNYNYGSWESGYAPNFVNVNVPGKSYPALSGGTVSRFSVDYGWTGLNEQNVLWAYTMAKAIQDEEPVPSGWRSSLSPGTETQFGRIHIPKGLVLKTIDLSTARAARNEWVRLKRKGVDPNQMKIWVPYRETTDDDRDSLLIYRLLVEIDRKNRAWPWKTWDTDLYHICQKVVWRYPSPTPVTTSPLQLPTPTRK